MNNCLGSRNEINQKILLEETKKPTASTCLGEFKCRRQNELSLNAQKILHDWAIGYRSRYILTLLAPVFTAAQLLLVLARARQLRLKRTARWPPTVAFFLY
ncbi:hypothetical protein SFRURICE_004124 [Spodoptera frugiperda]|nr:hypothetical protein SFRURICE_004124 [Spodoptera frugiperda]